ncbi:portal protein [Bacillus phage Moonbeam]|uniref:Uncharacterized protein n=1 Tax=Bacillus phage Moonbeam TaxID=1540091 RepID=A0A0A0RN01_9CAUD|nr:portal protein [Bacillus phage Moonbeam]AIW03450.1 hypothetical protein CPT_Moonbeam52 [Bacillus phage Moonbeam]
MTSFKHDPIWQEAKLTVGTTNWVEVAVCYRELGGENVFVYSLSNGAKRQIIDVLSDDTVLLLANGSLKTDTYSNVISSRKQFRYVETIETSTYILGDKKYTIATEIHK